VSQIEDLEEVSDFVAKCFPPDYKIFEFYEQRYQKWLYSRFVARIGALDSIIYKYIYMSVYMSVHV
jgi:hypothetical protein